MKSTVFIFMLLATFAPFSESQVLQVLGADNRPPKYFNDKGEPAGFVVEMTNYIMAHTDQRYVINLYPWKRAYTLALNGDGAIFGLSKNKERLNYFDYSKPMYFNDLMMIVRKDNHFEFDQLKDLKGKRISVLNGASYGDEFEQAKKQNLFILHEYTDPVSGLNMLLRGRIDAMIYGPGKHGVKQLLLKHQDQIKNLDRLTVLDTPFQRDANYLGIPKQLKMGLFLDAFNKGIDKGYESGEFQKIIDRYYLDSPQ